MDKPTLTRTISLGETTVCGFGHTLSLLLSVGRQPYCATQAPRLKGYNDVTIPHRQGDEILSHLYSIRVTSLPKRLLFKDKICYVVEPMLVGTIPIGGLLYANVDTCHYSIANIPTYDTNDDVCLHPYTINLVRGIVLTNMSSTM